MPPNAPPVEMTDETITQQLKDAYEKGFADGVAASQPKLSIFEACKREALRIKARDEIDALRQIRVIMEAKKAEYDEFMPRSDENLLLEAWKRFDSQRRSDVTAPVAPRQSHTPFEGEPKFEYEVVT